ncbi:TniQ family protein [Bacillus toyonensis]|uniref:TniQ family protein n=1 Tax=Bacillus toyonensis TaxID=155322 RepID=UPI0036B0AE71
MLSYFPKIYKDELLYSIFARYHKRSGNISYKQTYRDLFYNIERLEIFELPCYIQRLYEQNRLFQDLTVDEWINDHTAYRYYSRTMPKDYKERLRKKMLKGSTDRFIMNIFGFGTLKDWRSDYLRYCQECQYEDYEQNGETYWRVAHQLPSVWFCLKHQSPLLDSKVGLKTFSISDFYAADYISCPINQVDSKREQSKVDRLKLGITKKTLELFSKHPASNNSIERFEYYNDLLISCNYMPATRLDMINPLRSTLIYRDMEAFYGRELSSIILGNESIVDSIKWIEGFSKNSSIYIHAFHDIVFTYFLENKGLIH